MGHKGKEGTGWSQPIRRMTEGEGANKSKYLGDVICERSNKHYSDLS